MAVAIPKYVDITQGGKEANVRASLAAIRSTISMLYAQSAATSGGAGVWPATTLIQANLQSGIPGNKRYNNNSNIQVVTVAMTGTTGLPTSDGSDWMYSTVNGAFYAPNNTQW